MCRAMTETRECGFLFCFKKASEIDTRREQPIRVLFQRLIQLLTNSDLVHVEMRGVRAYTAAHNHFELYDYSYNTLLSPGFHRSTDGVCLGSAYEILYLPMTRAQTQRGIAFFETLVGRPYNVAGLGAAWLHQFASGHDQRTHRELTEQIGHSVFCTQVALRMCYITGACADDVSPELCTPPLLYHILTKNGARRVRLA